MKKKILISLAVLTLIAVFAGAALARRLQSGSLRAYVVYLLALVALLLLLARTGAL
ncbi:MAG: hypothetical protein K6U74_10560 [Firmicutes bacterium]|nr:hypothetical protein [Bacillota bacterium]